MRWAVVGAAAIGCALSAGILYGWMATTSAGDAPDWRTRDLLFLKSAHDRVLADLERQPAGVGEASLRREQQALLHAMTAIAQPMSADAIPEDVRLLLEPGDAPQAEVLAALFEAAATERTVELRTGLDTPRVPALDLAEMSVDPELRAPLVRKTAGKPPAGRRTAARQAKPLKAAAVRTGQVAAE